MESMNRVVRKKKAYGLAVIAVLIVLLVVSVSFNIGFLLVENKGGASLRGLIGGRCLENGFLTKTEFLAHYIVGSGETLESIAGVQLHDKSRAHEIYMLNSAAFKQAGVGEQVVLKQGMRLLIPPVEVKFASENVVGVAGRLTKIKGNVYGVSPKSGLILSLYSGSGTKLERHFAVGNCVEVIYYGDGSNQAVWISPQT